MAPYGLVSKGWRESLRVSTVHHLVSLEGFSDMSGFDRFWKVYPRKVARKYCRKIWDQLKLTPEQEEVIIVSVNLHIRTDWVGRPLKMIPHPSTFLNQGRWEDELEERCEALADDYTFTPEYWKEKRRQDWQRQLAGLRKASHN